MKPVATIFSVLLSGLIGYTVGYLSGAVTGTAIYWRKAQREHRAESMLRELDRKTTWDLSESE